MLPLAGYADRLSVRPGETIAFKVSNATGAAVEPRLVRVICADPNPAGPGITVEPVADRPVAVRAATRHPVPLGSYGVVDAPVLLAGLESFTVTANVMPTRVGRTAQIIMSWLDAAAATGAAVLVAEDGGLLLKLGCGTAGVDLRRLPQAFTEGRWHRVWVRYDAAARRIGYGVVPLKPGHSGQSAEGVLDHPLAAAAGGPIFLGGARDCSVGCPLNGRLELPALFDRALNAAELGEALSGGGPEPAARWDFSRGIETDRIHDAGPGGYDGRLVNSPTRAMTGSNWTGREMSWRHAPDQYGAIHFHEDDLDDCNWPTAFEWTVPKDLRSGAYALLLKAGDAEENIPFYVVPPKGRRTADIAVLVSTFTYTVYANHARPEWVLDKQWREAWRAQSRDWNAYPFNPGEHNDYALSTYNYHADGSGIAISSWHRPMLNVRIGYITYPYPEIRGSGLRHYPADSHLTAWLEAQGYRYDLVTDWELHNEGHALLKDYPLVLTGTHPEYQTRPMLDALEAYRDGGGRFCYLGGNGFYWKVALAPYKDGLIEIRRGEGGIRAWAADPGEYYNQFDGEYGGLWRRNGRPPQNLCGVGFTAQGNFVGSHYRLTDEARNPRVAWMLDGIAGDTIGGYGLSGHGAAGFELDRTDKRLGTPAHAIVLARSENHPPEAPWVLVPEEQLTHITTIPGQPAHELIHADMTFFETAGGKGAVFATGSITFCGSLPHNGYDNDISRLLRNVVERFLDPRSFTSG